VSLVDGGGEVSTGPTAGFTWVVVDQQNRLVGTNHLYNQSTEIANDMTANYIAALKHLPAPQLSPTPAGKRPVALPPLESNVTGDRWTIVPKQEPGATAAAAATADGSAATTFVGRAEAADGRGGGSAVKQEEGAATAGRFNTGGGGGGAQDAAAGERQVAVASSSGGGWAAAGARQRAVAGGSSGGGDGRGGGAAVVSSVAVSGSKRVYDSSGAAEGGHEPNSKSRAF
jgi:hypothetical protein